MRVAGYHTYFVGDPGWGIAVWAHNANYGGYKVGPDANYSSASQLPTLTLTQKLVSTFSKATGKSNNVRVGTQQEAESLLQQAFPRIYANPEETYSKGVMGFQVHGVNPSEMSAGNDLAHLKYYDWTPATKSQGVTGHIYFGSTPTSFSHG